MYRWWVEESAAVQDKALWTIHMKESEIATDQPPSTNPSKNIRWHGYHEPLIESEIATDQVAVDKSSERVWDGTVSCVVDRVRNLRYWSRSLIYSFFSGCRNLSPVLEVLISTSGSGCPPAYTKTLSTKTVCAAEAATSDTFEWPPANGWKTEEHNIGNLQSSGHVKSVCISTDCVARHVA